MTKNQKLWFWIATALFIVPEILWGPILGVLNLFLKINILPIFTDVQLINDNFILVVLILVCEAAGVAGLLKLTVRAKGINSFLKYVTSVVLVALLISIVIVFYLSFSLNSMWS